MPWTILISLGTWLVKNLGIYFLCFCLGFYCHYRLAKWWHGDAGPREAPTISETVAKVNSGNELLIKAGLFGRRTRKVILWGIEIPSDVADDARTHLQSLVKEDDDIRISIEQGRRNITDISGVVTAWNGVNCNLDQLRWGLAKVTVKNADFVAAQTEAMKAGRGIWSKQDPDKPPRPRPRPWPWREGEEP